MKYVNTTIGTPDLLGVFLRSLLIQASWSFERMQSLGFAYAMEPILRKLYPDKDEYARRLNLHADYFNTQPYLASFILGATIRMEHERASGREAATDSISLKSALMAPLGALGDSFFWGSLKPFIAVIAAALLMTGSWWAPVLFLIAYNVFHVGLRISLLFRGYASTGDAVVLMQHHGFTKMARAFKVTSLGLVGGILGMAPVWQPEFRPAIPIHGFVLSLSALGFALILIVLLRKGFSPVTLMLGLALFCIALTYTGVL